MKCMKCVFQAVLYLSVLLTVFVYPSVASSTIVETFYYTDYFGPGYKVTFSITVSIQTENDGTWRPDTNYTASLLINIDYMIPVGQAYAVNITDAAIYGGRIEGFNPPSYVGYIYGWESPVMNPPYFRVSGEIGQGYTLKMPAELTPIIHFDIYNSTFVAERIRVSGGRFDGPEIYVSVVDSPMISWDVGIIILIVLQVATLLVICVLLLTLVRRARKRTFNDSRTPALSGNPLLS